MENRIGLAVGRRIRRRRRLLAMTQTELGGACGVRFQQIQKYESGASRISATVLWRLARALGVDVNYFFDGIEDEASPPLDRERPHLRIAV